MSVFLNRGSSVACSYYHTLAVKTNGTVVTSGTQPDPYTGSTAYLSLGSWTNIIQVAAKSWCSIGLKGDGTVVAVGNAGATGSTIIAGWTGIQQISSSNTSVIGLKNDGTVVTYPVTPSPLDWTDIIAVSVYDYNPVARFMGVKADGTVVYSDYQSGSPTQPTTTISGINGVFTCVPGRTDTIGDVGINYDGSLSATGSLAGLAGRSDNIKVITGANNSIAIHEDGTVAQYSGTNTWTNIVDIAFFGGQLTPQLIGLKSDGTVVGSGDNTYGQLTNISSWSGVVVPTTRPVAPASITLNSKTVNSLSYSWATSSGATEYKLEGAGQTINQVPANYTFSGLAANYGVTPRVAAINGAGQSNWRTGTLTYTYQVAPSNPIYTPAAGSFLINFTVPLGVQTKRYLDGALVATGATNVHNFGPLNSNQSYNFAIRSINSAGEENPSGIATTRRTLAGTPLAAATPITGVTNNSISIDWEGAPSTDADRFHVYINGALTGSFLTATNYTATGLIPNTPYTFSVKALNLSNEINEDLLSFVPLYTLASQVTGLSMGTILSTSVNMSWTESTPAASGYNCYLNGVKLNTTLLPSGTTSFTLGDGSGSNPILFPNTTYDNFKVVAVNGDGVEETIGTTIAVVLTIPVTPENPTITNTSTNEITLTWDTPPNGADSYKVKVKVNGVEVPVTVTAITAI